MDGRQLSAKGKKPAPMTLSEATGRLGSLPRRCRSCRRGEDLSRRDAVILLEYRPLPFSEEDPGAGVMEQVFLEQHLSH
jgi:hypothetical protein